MNGRSTTDRDRRTVENQGTETALAFTSREDGTRHRFRFLHLEEQTGLWQLHEVKESRGWRIVDRKPIQQLRSGQIKPDLHHGEQDLIE